MPLISSLVSWLMKKRLHQIELFMKYPHEVQADWFVRLINTARNTEWGRKYDFASIGTADQFRERVPLNTYEDMRPFIDRLRRGEQNILWPSEISWFAKSSGTTGSKSKFIPVSREALEECHYKGGKDLLSIYCNNRPETAVFDGKLLGLGGSWENEAGNDEAYHGDVSAIIMRNLPFWIELMRTPSISIALMNEWEEKIEKMARITSGERVTALTGVPSWMLLLCRRVLEITGAQHIGQVWPNLELFVHGGVNFAPYREQFRQILPENLYYLETYNASEGFFGIQDQSGSNDMLLMLDYGIYYEFIPMEHFDSEEMKTVDLKDVTTGRHYAVVISTNAGLWRYLIGDTVRFTCLNPYRIQITGRTRNFINAFGEELIIEDAEKALAIACEKTRAVIAEYTAGPRYIKGDNRGAHEWLIEFEVAPENLDYFTEVFDNALKAANSDYEAKRYHSMILNPPVIRTLPQGTFYRWLKKKKKLGGQYKVPRLSNDRTYLDEILGLLH